MIQAPPMPRRLKLEHQNHSGSQIQREPTCLTHLRNKSFASLFEKVSETQSQFIVRNMLSHDLRSSQAKTTPIGASKPLRFASTMGTEVLDSIAQQVFCHVIRQGFSDPMDSKIRPRFVIQNMLGLDPRSSRAKTTPIAASKPLRHDPRSSRAKTTSIGASKQLRFANTTQIDVFDSLAQQVFCLDSEIRPRFVVQNMLRHDPRSSRAKTTPIGTSKPLRFTNTTRTDAFDSLAQQVFWLVIPEGL
ncbi:uncharacterized protein G2W53_026231 [Senna tora]|uniref:Uncharacterized protein n=1 Tax=Senna tora TaxID=362788 RepID=A0A834WIM0_9FABA|nr:uncharacterized protein G2W53_026231 [Senna tora]